MKKDNNTLALVLVLFGIQLTLLGAIDSGWFWIIGLASGIAAVVLSIWERQA